ncbi:hypothetical protein HOD88_03110 [archaeon]|jgi:hypothetical protein|nr:hypothetical protein [archaeon]
MQIKNRRAQEEMVGFAAIIILVAVIILIFLGFSMRNTNKEVVESYEVESYLEAVLQYTTECEDYLDHLTIKQVIFSCEQEEACQNGEDPCEILESTLGDISSAAWPYGEERPIKGYVLNITVEGRELESIFQGNQTNNRKASSQSFVKSGNQIKLFFEAYY